MLYAEAKPTGFWAILYAIDPMTPFYCLGIVVALVCDWNIGATEPKVDIITLWAFEAVIGLIGSKLPIVSTDPLHAAIYLFTAYATVAGDVWQSLYYAIVFCLTDLFIEQNKYRRDLTEQIIACILLTSITLWNGISLIYYGLNSFTGDFVLVRNVMCVYQIFGLCIMRSLTVFRRQSLQYIGRLSMIMLRAFYFVFLVCSLETVKRVQK